MKNILVNEYILYFFLRTEVAHPVIAEHHFCGRTIFYQVRNRDRLIDLEAYDHTWEAETPLELPQRTWPRSMLYLCDRNGAQVSCIDCTTECVFLISMGKKRHRYLLELEAPSLQVWFEQWMEREPEPYPESDLEHLGDLSEHPF